jgi:hypothetical protein
MNKNRIGGLRWRASQPMIAKPISIKPTTAAQCVASGYVDPYPCACFFRVAGNGSGPPDSFPRPGRPGSGLSRLRPSLGFAHRVGTVIDGDWQRIFPETPQPFFEKSISIVGWPLQADPRFSSEIGSALSLVGGCAPLPGNASSPFAGHSLLQGLEPPGTQLIHASPLRHTFSGVGLAPRSHLQFTGIFLSGHQHCSPPSYVAGPLVAGLTFGVHSRLTQPPCRFRKSDGG